MIGKGLLSPGQLIVLGSKELCDRMRENNGVFKMHFLVTGYMGFKGAYLVKLLLKKGHFEESIEFSINWHKNILKESNPTAGLE